MVIKKINDISADDFGNDFKWGVSTAATQIEGAWNEDGKGPSIWDTFAAKKGKIKNNETPKTACNHYHRYTEDIDIIKNLNIKNYRFSLAWTRIFPAGKGMVNQKGIDFYNKVIDACLQRNITPWITLYHWDLPQALEEKGGWMNRDTVYDFCNYVTLCVQNFGDRVKNFMVLNEPLVTAGAGYFLGVHAPGKRGAGKFLKALHHLALAQAEGGRTVKNTRADVQVGTTFSCALVQAVDDKVKNKKAAIRMDALLNRIMVEPLLGLHYPIQDLPFLSPIEKHFRQDDEQRLAFNMDFIGIQNYTREIVNYSLLTPYVHAGLVSANKRNVETTAMGWEIYPESIYAMLKKFATYKNMPPLVITESGMAMHDVVENGIVSDDKRIAYIRAHLQQVLRAKNEKVAVNGFFIWSLMDNFEWAEGYHPRFGLVHIDFETHERTLKNSAFWLKEFLS
jgi:beta-glucosidase